MQQPKLLPNIEDYLEQIDNNQPVKLGIEFDSILDSVCSQVELDREKVKIICTLFFQMIRNQILRGNIVNIKNIGKLFVSSPATTGLVKRVFIKFKPSKNLVRKINERNRI